LRIIRAAEATWSDKGLGLGGIGGVGIVRHYCVFRRYVDKMEVLRRLRLVCTVVRTAEEYFGIAKGCVMVENIYRTPVRGCELELGSVNNLI
jgi:hypothetical protein